MIETELLNYGMAGIFIIYLIWDKAVILKKLNQLSQVIRSNTEVIRAFTCTMKKR